MKKTQSISYASMIAVCLMCVTSHTWSQSDSLNAHVHGIAELLIAIEGEQIEVQFLSPAANILGFEHTPSTDEQWQRINRAEKFLHETDTLFSFQNIPCQPFSVLVEMSLASEPSSDHNHHSSHENDHAEGHHQHGEDSHENHSDHTSHTEVSAHYRFQCTGERPKEIQVQLLEKFPGIESLKVQWITESRQGSQTLNQDLSLVRFE